MNILILKNPLESTPGGGGELHTMQVARHLRDRGHKVYFAGSCPESLKLARQDSFSTEEINWAGPEAVNEKSILKFFLKWPSIKKKYKKFLEIQKQKNNIDTLYIISWNEKFLLGSIAKNLGMKLIFIEHRLLGRFIKLNPFKAWYIKNSRQAINIAVSKTVEQSMIDIGVPREQIKLVYNGIDPAEFENTEIQRRGNEIGVIARLDKEKGLSYLIEAVSKLQADFLNLRLEIVGVGPEKPGLQADIKRLSLEDKVKFLGNLDRQSIAKFLSRIDIFALPAIMPEAFGLVFAEAGFMKVPVVTTNIGAAREIIIDNKTGLLIPPNDTNSLASALKKLLRDKNLREQMGETAHKRIVAKFTIDKMLNGITAIIESK